MRAVSLQVLQPAAADGAMTGALAGVLADVAGLLRSLAEAASGCDQQGSSSGSQAPGEGLKACRADDARLAERLTVGILSAAAAAASAVTVDDTTATGAAPQARQSASQTLRSQSIQNAVPDPELS